MSTNDKPEALRQSQSLPAGAVAEGDWNDWFESWATNRGMVMQLTEDGRFLSPDTSLAQRAHEAGCMTTHIYYMELCRKEELEKQALQTDAREKGEAVAWRVETPYGVGYTFAEEMIAYMNDRDPDPAEPVAAKPAGEKVKMRNEDPRHGLYRVLQQRRNRLSPIDIARIENAIAALATQPAQASEKDNG